MELDLNATYRDGQNWLLIRTMRAGTKTPDSFALTHWSPCGVDEPEYEEAEDNRCLAVPRGSFTLLAGDEFYQLHWDGARLICMDQTSALYRRAVFRVDAGRPRCRALFH